MANREKHQQREGYTFLKEPHRERKKKKNTKKES